MSCCRCSDLATAWMVFDYPAAEIELFDLTGAAGAAGRSGGYAMCESHAGALTAPVGWSLRDRRSATPVLFPVGALTEPPRAESEVA